MHFMTVIVIFGLALAMSTIIQGVVFFLILRAERKFTKDLLNRLASRTVGEYAQVTKILETAGEPKEYKDRAEEGGPIPIFS